MQFIQMKYSEELCNLGNILTSCVIAVDYYQSLNICHLIKFTFLTGRHLHSLAYAASGYHRVLEENRKLYNQVQDLRGGAPLVHIMIFALKVCIFQLIFFPSLD